MFPLKKGTAPNQAHVGIPDGTVEEEHGRQGFAGRASHLYRLHPPTGWIRISGSLRPRAFACSDLAPSDRDDPEGRPIELLQSEDAVISVSRRAASMPYYFRNADGDELYFIHQGTGRLETDYGVLSYEPGDYIVIPKGTTYRVVTDRQNFMLIVQTRSPISIPERGLLGHHALFDYGVLVAPEPQPVEDRAGEWEVRIKRGGQYTSVIYPFCPMDVVGWKGDLWVAKLNVRDFRPVMSPRYHLPPSVHATFVAGGAMISTFVPRPLESDPESLRVPFYHRNMDYDEILFYHAGEFFSRAGIGPGMMTLHPQGIHHGPHPKAIEASKTKTHTDEIAVMVESQSSFTVTSEAEAVEWKDYALSWTR